MITGNKIMDIPRHLLHTLFTDTKFPLIQHHRDSFNDFLDVGIPGFIKASNPFELALPDSRFIRIYIGGRDGTALRYESPQEDDGSIIVPHACRLDNKTYAFSLFADIEAEFEFSDGSKSTKKFPNVLLGKIPLMLRSRLCYLSAIDGYEIGECKYEMGGYFIIDGSEKVLLTQELLGNNMFYAGERKRKAPKGTLKSAIEKETPIAMEMKDAALGEDATYEEHQEYYTGIRTFSEDGARGPYSHFLTLPADMIGRIKLPGQPAREYPLEEMKGNLGRDNRLVMIQIPGFQQPVPVLSVFRALGVTSDRDLYNIVLAGVADKDRVFYDDIFQQIVLSHEKYLYKAETTDLEILSSQARNKSKFEVVVAMHELLFSHVEGSREDTGALFRRKAYLLGHMLKMSIDVALDRRAPSDRDNMQFKRLKTSGVLMFEEFRRMYRELRDEMLVRLDKRHTYRVAEFRDKALVNILEAENITYFWRKFMLLNGYLKSFKGMWGDRAGIAQELARPSYMSVIHHLRKTDLQIDKSTSTAPPRRYYASQVGLMCPIDSPDGSDIGYKKSLTVLARVTTAFPSAEVKTLLREVGLIRFTEDIHPTTWRPEWTKVFLNSDLVGACIGNTEDLHTLLLKARRDGRLPIGVTLGWKRVNNEYAIYCDAGRPIRPVYREGTDPEAIRKAKTWNAIADHLDFIDASETDCLRLSLEPFHPIKPSEIHMSFNLSAIANLVPYPDHNPGPRSVFSIAQQKQAASWYHTNYMKRFDTISMMAMCPQRPLSQTWIYSEMMGAGGCLGYGENAIVAFTIYGGHNQEDSVIINQASLKRGMYRTMYYHSYDIQEEALEMATKIPGKDEFTIPIHTEIKNPLRDESVKRKEGWNYELLDADGIIKVNSIVDDKTTLVGMLSPIRSPTGQVTGYSDVSVKPKRGQHGRIDAVYRYQTAEGLRGVKIRIAEERVPTIGDKMASRHSQKGTIGMITPEEDMPFTGTGMKPDIIFNPHGIPTRMTVGQFLETISNKLGLHLGSLVDATPFTVNNRVQDIRNAMIARGFEPYGNEILYNGQTGEMMESLIFMGPIYYQRLKHMVEDKINYRNTGPMTLLTHQPTQGRGDEGGLRIGEMERDALISHGMMKFLTESMMERSDGATIQFNKEEGRFDVSRDTLDVPYSMALFTQELESMHIDVKMET
jgi:DNA-directed RNA polymerase II subunit RPB2